MRTECTDENVYLCGMDNSRLLSIILPEALIDNFEIVNTEKSATRFDIWLQEKPLLSKEDQRSGQVISNGFGDYRVIQDYPLRGWPTYLHVRKRGGMGAIHSRKWRDHAPNHGSQQASHPKELFEME